MMSKHPIEDEELPLHITGISRGPNVGYDPYWRDKPDIEWREKCSRCPALFQRYSTVCAIDSTGDVLVNISMCKLVQMNCLNGIVWGRTKNETEDLGVFYAVDDGWARFSARQWKPLHIRLAFTPDKKFPYYWIVIDGNHGRINYLGRNGDLWQRNYNYNYKLLDNVTYTEFVIYWNSSSGWFLMTLSKLTDYRHGFYFNFTDRAPFPIKYIAISGEDYTNDWVLNGFLVTQLTPCKSHIRGLARAVPTSPTEIPVVMSQMSPGNIAYFSRVDYANVNQDQVSFLTREEY